DLAARRAQATGEGLAVLTQQEAFLQADVEVVPGQPRARRNGSEIAALIDVEVLERFAPGAELKLVFPRVERRTVLVGAFDHVGQATVATRQDPFQHAGLCS